MNLDNLTAKRIVMRRLFKQDMDSIINCYKKFDELFYNPIDEDFITDVLLNGEVWGAYLGTDIVACCYFMPLECEFFKERNTFAYLADFIDEPEKYMYMGYIGTNFEAVNTEKQNFLKAELNKANGLYTAFCNVAHLQTFRQGLKYILHSTPYKLAPGLEPLFAAGYTLVKLRGLDNLVVHYIFAKAVLSCEDIYCAYDKNDTKLVPFAETKTVSAFLENGYCAVDMDDKNFLMKRLIAD